MATTVYFEEIIADQGGKDSISLELGRSSFYSGCDTPKGTGEDSIYIRTGDASVIMDRATAKRFVDAVTAVGIYFGFDD